MVGAVWRRETGIHRFVGANGGKEVELRPLPEVDKEPNRMRKDILIYPGAVDHTLEARGQLPGAWTTPVGFGDDRYTFGITSPEYPGPIRGRPGAEIPPVKLTPDPFVFGFPIPAHLNWINSYRV